MTDQILQTAQFKENSFFSPLLFSSTDLDGTLVKTASSRAVTGLHKYRSEKPLRSSLRPQASHFAYLDRIVGEGLVSIATAETAKHIWAIAWRSARRLLRAPASGVGAKGELISCWERGSHYIEVEILESNVEWFYRDRSTQVVSQWELGDQSLPDDLQEKLRLVTE